MMVHLCDSNNWVDSLLFVQRIYNSLLNTSTGLATARILYGHVVNLDRQLHLELPVRDGTTTYKAYLNQLLAHNVGWL